MFQRGGWVKTVECNELKERYVEKKLRCCFRKGVFRSGRVHIVQYNKKNVKSLFQVWNCEMFLVNIRKCITLLYHGVSNNKLIVMTSFMLSYKCISKLKPHFPIIPFKKKKKTSLTWIYVNMNIFFWAMNFITYQFIKPHTIQYIYTNYEKKFVLNISHHFIWTQNPSIRYRENL